MKRLAFLSTAGAAVLAGCGGHQGLSALPGMSHNGTPPAAPSGALRLVPQAADAIPANVLTHPIIGEAWRFDGATAPAGWAFLRGQEVSIAENKQLFSVLGQHTAKPSDTTFVLPNSKVRAIVALNGALPSSPQALAQYRPSSPQRSLGPGAAMPPPAVPKPVPAPVLEARALAAGAPRYSDAAPVPVGADLAARIASAKSDARTACLQSLGAASRAQLDNAIASAAAGSISLDGAVRSVAGVLSSNEAAAVLNANDAFVNRFNSNWGGTPRDNAALNAANALFAIVPSRDQVLAIGDAQDR
ncbi:MAG TPA: phage tail protein [Candidatus Baltobacteraceae bacterium]|nr:phage tail protein [Candidatus Baltobacteraceae bacterium]